jgi:predicted glycosyltransferase
MTDKHLKELASEIGASLQDDAVAEGHRAVLEQVHSELQAVLAEPAKPPLGLRDKLTQALEQLEGEHPRLTSLLSKALDMLSDVGI